MGKLNLYCNIVCYILNQSTVLKKHRPVISIIRSDSYIKISTIHRLGTKIDHIRFKSHRIVDKLNMRSFEIGNRIFELRYIQIIQTRSVKSDIIQRPYIVITLRSKERRVGKGCKYRERR